MGSKGRYLRSQKLTNTQIERILSGYAEGMTANEFIRHAQATMRAPPAAKTVHRIYRLIRKRLSELNTYTDAEMWLMDARGELSGDSSSIRPFFLSRGLEEKIGREAARRRGLTEANWREMMGEFIFRTEMAHVSPTAFMALINRAVRITVRLNEPLKNRDLWQMENEIIGYEFYIDYARELYRDNPAAVQSLVTQYELEIEWVRRRMKARLRKLDRERRKQGTAIGG